MEGQRPTSSVNEKLAILRKREAAAQLSDKPIPKRSTPSATALRLREYRKRKKLETLNGSMSQPNTTADALRMREYRKQKKLENSNDSLSQPTTDALRMREYRAHKKLNDNNTISKPSSDARRLEARQRMKANRERKKLEAAKNSISQPTASALRMRAYRERKKLANTRKSISQPTANVDDATTNHESTSKILNSDLNSLEEIHESTINSNTITCNSANEERNVENKNLDVHGEHNPAKRKSSAERSREYRIRKRLEQALFNISQDIDNEHDLTGKKVEKSPTEQIHDNKLRTKLSHSQIATRTGSNSVTGYPKDDSKPSTSVENDDDAAMENILDSLYERLKMRGVDAYPLFNRPVPEESNNEAYASQDLQIEKSNELPLTIIKVEPKLEDFDEEIEVKHEPIVDRNDNENNEIAYRDDSVKNEVVYRNDDVNNKKILVDKATEYEEQETTPIENIPKQLVKIGTFGISEVPPPLHWIKCSQTQPTITTYQHTVATKQKPRPLGEESNTSRDLQIVNCNEFLLTAEKVKTKPRDLEKGDVKSLPILYTNDNIFESGSANGGSIEQETDCDDTDIFFKRITETVKTFPKSLIFEAKQRIFEVVHQLEEEIERGAFLEHFS